MHSSTPLRPPRDMLNATPSAASQSTAAVTWNAPVHVAPRAYDLHARGCGGSQWRSTPRTTPTTARALVHHPVAKKTHGHDFPPEGTEKVASATSTSATIAESCGVCVFP